MRIAIGANHRGYQIRAELIEMLAQLRHEVLDCGVSDDRPVDYPDVAVAVAEMVGRTEADRGILIGGTGVGMCITANKVPGVRAAPCHDDMTAEYSRRHNDSNVLCLSAALLGDQLIRHIVQKWLETPFEGGRHAARLQKISLLERDPLGIVECGRE